ncbi:MAG TPA: carbonic anhydrase [Thermoanaerobaculia bacterium]|jgi:carbonic anhydrase
MHRLIRIDSPDDMPEPLRGSPVQRLVLWHNTGEHPVSVDHAEMLVGMCMDNRKKLRIPENFAFILRAGGGNLRPSEFKVSYAVAVGGVRTIAIMVHNHCGMVGLEGRHEQFVQGLVDAGWDHDLAEQHFHAYAPLFEIGNEIDFALSETQRLRLRYPKVLVAPLLYNVDDNLIYCIEE